MSEKHHQLEEGSGLLLDFDKLKKIAATGHSVLPAVIQDVVTKEVLLVGYVNRQALDYTLENRVATMWSTSRNELWVKGATSGDYLDLVEIRVNCEQNSLLYLVKIRGKGACHTKDAAGNTRFGCYYRRLTDENKLEKVP